MYLPTSLLLQVSAVKIVKRVDKKSSTTPVIWRAVSVQLYTSAPKWKSLGSKKKKSKDACSWDDE